MDDKLISAEQPQPACIDPMQNPLRPTLAKLGPAGEHPAEEALRKLAYWLGVGGYNAPTVDADLFHRKIVDGIQSMLAERPAAAPSEAQDAARYRWLRDAHPRTEPVCVVDSKDATKLVRYEFLDAIIDTALKEQQ